MFRLRCDETGDRSLDRAGAQGEKDPVEKAEDAGEETGGCEKNCSGDEWMGLMGRRHGSSEMAEGFGYIYVERRDGYDSIPDPQRLLAA